MARKRHKWRRRLVGLAVVLLLLAAAAWVVYGGGGHEGPGTVTSVPAPAAVVDQRAAAVRAAAVAQDVADPDMQILFGDLHVHTTFSADAFMMSLPLMGGQGAHPPADACDFARFCSGLDFFAITDHAESLTPQHWRETLDSIRACNAVAGDPNSPDLVAFAGFEWSQVGVTPAEHYGHRCVVFRDTDDDHLPARPIAAPGMTSAFRRIQTSSQLAALLVPIEDFSRRHRYLDLFTFLRENAGVEPCPTGVDTRSLPPDCREVAETPADLLEKLGQWGFDALVIPHGMSWGFYTPPGYEWHAASGLPDRDGRWQRLIEVYSGHGSSEQYRPWRAQEPGPDGQPVCPEPTADFEPCCWRAGEIIRRRCGDVAPDVCEQRVEAARAAYVAAGVAGHLTVPGASVEDWGDCGQCTDCFLPAFNYRPGGSVQAVVARTDFSDPAHPRHARLGFIASSDNHTARPGTGYKELFRHGFTEATGPESETWRDRIFGEPAPATAEAVSYSRDDLLARPGFTVLNLERQASFFMTGGLVAVHSRGRGRQAIWEALQARRVYGTSGPRILLWFDLVDAPDGRQPMGSDVVLGVAPRFEVRAVGALRQQPGCPGWVESALGAERLQYLCGGECDNPSDERLRITRIEVVRIRPQVSPDEPLDGIIEDPWRTLECPPDPSGCRVTFDDPDFPSSGRDALYYVRAIQEPTPAVNGGGLRCDDQGVCQPCYGDYRTPRDDDCLADVEERAWSSPIYLEPGAPAGEPGAPAGEPGAPAGEPGAPAGGATP